MSKAARNAGSVNRLDALTAATVADAKSLNAPLGSKVITSGYYSEGDGGGNEYIVVLNGTGTDDGGSFIDMDNGLQLEGVFNSFVYVEQFGANPAAANNKPFIEAASSAAPLGSEVTSAKGGVFPVTDGVVCERGDIEVNLKLSGTTPDGQSNAYIVFKGTPSADTALVSDLPKGSRSITLPTGVSAHMGDLLWLKSNAVLWGGTNLYGELVRVKSVSSGVAEFYERTLLSYNTAENATIANINALKNIKATDFVIQGSGSVSLGSGLRFEYCDDVIVRNPVTTDLQYTHVNFRTCGKARVFGGSGRGTLADVGLNYGVAVDFSCYDVKVYGYEGDSMRHTVATGGSVGVNRSVKAYFCNFTNQLDAGLDAHPSTYYTDYSKNSIECVNNSPNGIICQGANFKAKDNVISGARCGVFHQPALETTEVAVSSMISGNESSAGDADKDRAGYLFDPSSSATAPIKSVQIINNDQEGHGLTVQVLARLSDINKVNVSGNTGDSETRGIQIRAIGSSILSACVNGNQSKLVGASTAENIYLLAANTTDATIKNVTIGGNVTENGSYPIRIVNCDNVKTDGSNLFVNNGTPLVQTSTNVQINET